MNKFHIISILIHGTIFFTTTNILKSKVEPLKFVEKKSVTVSLQNKRAVSLNQEVNQEVTKEPIEEVEKKEEIKEEPVKEIKEEKKIIEPPKPKEKAKKVLKKEKKKEIKKLKKPKPKKTVYNEFQDKNKFIQGTDGIFTAVLSDGIQYEILKEVDPKYPNIAKKMGYKGTGEVLVSFTVNLNGEVENIKFISGETKFGFKDEVFKALKSWRFKPIIYKNKKIKVNFEKNFKFK